jgi:hypothetical protein
MLKCSTTSNRFKLVVLLHSDRMKESDRSDIYDIIYSIILTKSRMLKCTTTTSSNRLLVLLHSESDRMKESDRSNIYIIYSII